jgi:hypothetical protein
MVDYIPWEAWKAPEHHVFVRVSFWVHDYPFLLHARWTGFLYSSMNSNDAFAIHTFSSARLFLTLVSRLNLTFVC